MKMPGGALSSAFDATTSLDLFMTGGSNNSKIRLRKETRPPLLEPVAAFEEWKRHHSVEAIRANPRNRSFIVAGYSCLRQVGVQLNDFLNGLLQAIVTNRTFLYRYDNFAGWVARGDNAPHVCDRILRRAAWMPNYEKTRDEYNQSYNNQNQNNNSTTNNSSNASAAAAAVVKPLEPIHGMANPPHAYDPHDKKKMFDRVDRGEPLFDNVSHKQVLQPPRMWGTSSVTEVWPGWLILTNKYASAYIGSAHGIDNLAQTRIVQQLYSQGPSFLYGMLLFNSFQFTEELLQTISPNDWRVPKPGELSIALHSRQDKIGMDGSDVTNEVQCLDDILDTRENKAQPCSVYVMSDRELTVEGFTREARSRGCHVVTVTDRGPPINDTTKTAEHGPFAGIGYFQDLAVATQARSALISRRRSSSAILDEIIEYRRRMEAWEARHERIEEPILRCYIGGRLRTKKRKRKSRIL